MYFYSEYACVCVYVRVFVWFAADSNRPYITNVKRSGSESNNRDTRKLICDKMTVVMSRDRYHVPNRYVEIRM